MNDETKPRVVTDDHQHEDDAPPEPKVAQPGPENDPRHDAALEAFLAQQRAAMGFT